MGTLLISLVSDQTIPNVQLIKEYKNQITDFLFITTQYMESKGCRRWVEKSANIESLKPIIVNEYSYDDIQSKLNSFDFSKYDKLVLNLTGGTKVMTLAAHDFFKEEGADIFYITGKDNNYIKIFPGKKKHVETLKEKISIKEYLTAYGFELVLNKNKNLDKEITERVYDFFISERIIEFVDVLNYLRDFRSKGIKNTNWTERVEEFLNEIGFKTSVEKQLSEYETKFLTGEWFEQYVYYKIIDGLELEEDMIYNGVTIIKEVKDNESVKVESLLGIQDLKRLGSDNEIDVMFMYNGKFYVIECKSSIIDKKEVEINKNGNIEKVLKDNNILGETIYKSDSIKTKFGLFANSYIFTLTDFKAYINEGDPSKKNNKFKSMLDLINRAALSKIEIRDRSKLLECINYKDLL